MSQPSWLTIVRRPGILLRSVKVAAVVGTVLNLINQYDAMMWSDSVNWVQICLTYCVPFCVATYGAVAAVRAHEAQA